MKITTKIFLYGPLLFFFLIIGTSKTFSQVDFSMDKSVVSTPAAYLGFGMGLEAYTGILGLKLEIPAIENFSVFGTAGLGSWGYKIGFGGSYYFRAVPFGSIVSLGYCYATGLGSQVIEFPGTNGQTPVGVYYNGAGTVIPAYSHGWRIGNKFNRFILTTGYSIKTKRKAYSLANKNTQLHPDVINALEILQPGGLTLAVEFMFTIGSKSTERLIDDF